MELLDWLFEEEEFEPLELLDEELGVDELPEELLEGLGALDEVATLAVAFEVKEGLGEAL